uniref:Uncharacterized protein n=1 Tax=Cyanoderma ruficeps TaxID=181631 RepID=A0A8C3QII1_9PASS
TALLLKLLQQPRSRERAGRPWGRQGQESGVQEVPAGVCLWMAFYKCPVDGFPEMPVDGLPEMPCGSLPQVPCGSFPQVSCGWFSTSALWILSTSALGSNDQGQTFSHFFHL